MKRDAVTITDGARAYVSEVLSGNPGKHLRVSINNKGCSGHKYQYDLMDWDDIRPMDEVVDWEGGRLVVDAMSLLGLLGSRLDLRTTQFESQLVWDNPMAMNSCGCGESFQLSGEGR